MNFFIEEVLTMNKDITEYDKFKVLRPLDEEIKLDEYDMPIMKKVELSSLDFECAIPTNLQNLTHNSDNRNKLVFPFNYDKNLNRYWDDPLKYIPLFQSVMGIGTPDYSLYSNMNSNEIRHNVFKNRWLGCTWRSYGVNAIPTIGWSFPDTYDICFSGVEQNSIVMISTVGCKLNADIFFKGYKEMQNRLNPALVIVYGDMIPGMTGTFVNYKMTDCFNETNTVVKQEKLFDVSPIFKLEEAYCYGV